MFSGQFLDSDSYTTMDSMVLLISWKKIHYSHGQIAIERPEDRQNA
jgi:hypothetical protein